jgi:hypothetical protein
LAKKKGQPSLLAYLGPLLTESRHGLVVPARADPGEWLRGARGGVGHAGSPSGRGTDHPGSRKHKQIEEVFGWMKTVGLMRKIRHTGRRRVGWMLVFRSEVYNLVHNLAGAT